VTNVESTFDDVAGGLTETAIVAAGIRAQYGEGVVHVEASMFGDHAFGLLDHDARLERGFELCRDGLCAVPGAGLRIPMVATSASACATI
jgi:hypothetical protein